MGFFNKEFKIGNKWVGENHPTYFIAEIGANFDGSIEKAKRLIDAAKEAGADFIGLDEYVEKIKAGWTDFDVMITQPQYMGKIGALGRVLGPRGLMPNPKSGTVTMDVAKAVNEIKAGKIEYRLDKSNIVHVPVGKASFTEEQLNDNFQALTEAIMKAKPASLKGQYIKSLTLASTMGPGVKVNTAKLS